MTEELRSSVPGVVWDKSRQRWRAYIGYPRKFIGSSKSKEEAERLRLEADKGTFPSDEEKESLHLNKMARIRMRCVWRDIGTDHTWNSFDHFISTVGFRDKEKNRLVQIDESKPIGPDNFQWIEPKFNFETQEGRKSYYRYRYENDPDYYRRAELRNKFGITIEQYNEMHKLQNGVCAICSKPETALRKGKLLPLSVDHNHETGQVRSLLCTSCNIGIGSLQEDITLLNKAIDYLVKWDVIWQTTPNPKSTNQPTVA